MKRKLFEEDYRRRWYIISEYVNQKGLKDDFEMWFEEFKKNPTQKVKPLGFWGKTWRTIRKYLGINMAKSKSAAYKEAA